MIEIYGGLRPIWSRVLLDVVAVAMILGGILIGKVRSKTLLLGGSALLTLVTAGLTKRWPLSFPTIAILLVQGVGQIGFLKNQSWIAALLKILSLLLAFMTTVLIFAFPAMQPPQVNGPYSVGVVDLFLPVNLGILNGTQLPGHVNARLLYPTSDQGSMPYLRPETAAPFLEQSILYAAPPPINTLKWFLDNWYLISLDSEIGGAKPLDRTEKFPMVAYSHGLGGSAQIYTHQTRSLAAQGYVVVVVDHSDGSNPAMLTKEGELKLMNRDILELLEDGKDVEYVEARRQQTEIRAAELAGAMVALRGLDKSNLPELDKLGVSFVGKLQTDTLHAMGHSFGAATALTVVFRKPELAESIIAHDPAVDWCPNDVRRSIFPENALEAYVRDTPTIDKGTQITLDGETGGWGIIEKPLETTYDDMPALFLFSTEWYEKSWAGSKLFEYMNANGFLPSGDYAQIEAARHNEFSDMCVLTPLWLARGLNVTGYRNPIDTEVEMAERTIAYLQRNLVPDSTGSQTKHDKSKEEL